jgi:hypothetical protein
MASESSGYLPDDLDNFDNYFDYSSFFNTPMGDGASSTASALSTAHAASSPGGLSVSMLTPGEDIFMQPNNHPQAQCNQEQINTDDGLEAMEGVLYNLGNSDILGDGFLSNYDWNHSAQLPNYTFNRYWPASSLHSNNVPRLQDMTCDLDHSVPNDFSNHTSRIADDPLLGAQNVPQHMTTSLSIAPRTMSAFAATNICHQDINSHYPTARDTCNGLFEELPFNFGQSPNRPTPNVNLSASTPNATLPGKGYLSPSSSVATFCHENSPSSTKTLESGSSLSEVCGNGVSNTAAHPVYSRLRKNLPILPVPAKLYPRAPPTSKDLARLKPVYGPQEARPRRNYRRKLTEKGKENFRQVRKNGSCIVCMMKNQKVIVFLHPRSSVMADLLAV